MAVRIPMHHVHQAVEEVCRPLDASVVLDVGLSKNRHLLTKIVVLAKHVSCRFNVPVLRQQSLLSAVAILQTALLPG